MAQYTDSYVDVNNFLKHGGVPLQNDDSMSGTQIPLRETPQFQIFYQNPGGAKGMLYYQHLSCPLGLEIFMFCLMFSMANVKSNILIGPSLTFMQMLPYSIIRYKKISCKFSFAIALPLSRYLMRNETHQFLFRVLHYCESPL